MSLLAISLVVMLAAVTANANQACDIQDCATDRACVESKIVPMPPVKYASPGGKWTPENAQEICTKHGNANASRGFRVKACNNNQSLEYPDIHYVSQVVHITCAPDHPCPDGVTVYPSLCC